MRKKEKVIFETVDDERNGLEVVEKRNGEAGDLLLRVINDDVAPSFITLGPQGASDLARALQEFLGEAEKLNAYYF